MYLWFPQMRYRIPDKAIQIDKRHLSRCCSHRHALFITAITVLNNFSLGQTFCNESPRDMHSIIKLITFTKCLSRQLFQVYSLNGWFNRFHRINLWLNTLVQFSMLFQMIFFSTFVDGISYAKFQISALIIPVCVLNVFMQC